MKIAIISHLKYPIGPPFAGGLESFIYRLVVGLRKRQHQVTVYASGDSAPELMPSTIMDISSIRASEDIPEAFRSQWIAAREREAFAQCCDELSKENFDIIHNNSLSPQNIEFLDRSKLPAITTLHVPPIPGLREAVASWQRSENHHYVNVSSANRSSWTDFAGFQSVIYNGIDLECFSTATQRNTGTDRLIWFGRICPEKGLHLALEAARKMGLPLDFAGPITDRSYFDEYVRHLISPRDRYLGHLSSDQLRPHISAAAVSVVTPRWEEPFGLVVAESLACGTPVAAFDRGAMRELIVDKVGRLATPDSVDDLVKAICECLDLNPADCIARASSTFGIESMIDQYETMYHQVSGLGKTETNVRKRPETPVGKPICRLMEESE